MALTTTPSALPNSVWAVTAPPPIETTPLAGDITTNVVIVGAGYTGLSTALHLAPGVNTVVLEASEIGFGASGRNNGLAIPTLAKADPEEILRIFGPEKGEATINLIRDSAKLVFDLIREHNMEKAGEQNGWIQPAHSPGRMRLVERRLNEWTRRGAKADLLSREALRDLIGSDAWHGGWVAHEGGTVHPMAYARGLAKAAAGKGARIHTRSPAVALERGPQGWIVRTPEGSVTAERVVLATNAYSDDLWPRLRRTFVPVKTWQMATKPLSDNVRRSVLPGRHALSDTRGDLQFARYDWDGRLISGASLIFDVNTEERLKAQVGARLKRNFPQLGDVEWEFVWSGFLAMTPDFLPRLHVLAPGVFSWLGCNGRGVALATAMGPVLADLAKGGNPEDAPLPIMEPRAMPMHGLVTRFARTDLWRRRRLDTVEYGS
ncbi:MAG: FAD-binding oxidoreductase [Alphaproteobacteria bacterium]|nr:FAD-binding oxidoreductase [Alphaproteobacteria bacterium]